MSREMFSGNLRNRLHSDEWLIWQDQYEAKENLKYESLFALSNGYLGIRGSHEEGTKITLPYLYINGVFDKSETFMRELSTLPNWLGIRLYLCLVSFVPYCILFSSNSQSEKSKDGRNLNDAETKLAKRRGQKLLALLVQHVGMTVPRETLMDRIWTDGAVYVDENALSVAIKRLRDKLQAKEQIRTVYGIGYVWEV